MPHIPHMFRTIALALTILLPGGSAGAQDTPVQEPGTFPTPVELSPSPTDLDTLGVRLYLPMEASAQTTIIPGGRAKTVITPEDESWLIQVFSSISSNKALTAKEALDAVVSQRKEQLQLAPLQNRPAQSLVEEIDRVDDLRLGGRPGSRSYVSLWSPEPTAPVTGYTLINMNPGQFLIVQLDCSSAVFPRARAVYETVCAAAEFPGEQELDTTRTAAILAGREFLASLNSDDLDAAIEGAPVWIRIFVPAATSGPGDAREVGYQKLEVRKGQLGELDPNRDKSGWSVSEREVGYIVKSEARMLQDTFVFDSRAIYFLSLDRQRESWSVLVEQKSGSSVAKTMQTVVRTGTRLSVRTEKAGFPAQAKDFDLPAEQYISAVERHMLPRLVAHKMRDTGPTLLDMAFYSFDGARDTVTLRRETFDRSDDGLWVCETSPGEDQPTWTSTYAEDGAMLSRLIPPLQVMEPTTPERIRALWKGKRLPIDQ